MRIPLYPSLKQERLNPRRAEHPGVARGVLATVIRTTIRGQRCLIVGKDAPRTLSALSCDYKYPVATDSAKRSEPVDGPARLIAEALETAMAVVLRELDAGGQEGRHYAVNAQGVRYQTALPQRRASP